MKTDANEYAQKHGVEQLRRAIDTAATAGPYKAGKTRFDLIPFDSLTAALTSAYLVKGIIPKAGLVVVWGEPKCGKSFWVFTVTLHIALGWEYRARRVQRGDVVYLALEGQSGFCNRAEAFRSGPSGSDRG